MRAMLVSTLLSSLVALAIGSPARADESATPANCSGTLVLGVQTNGYPYQDLGFDGSNHKPVSQDMVAVTCGHVTVDWWTSVQLTGGKYGRRGKGDEHDFEFAYANTAQTPIGTVNYVAYAAYFALDLGKGLTSTSDDYVQVYGEVSRSFAVSKSWTVAPFARYIHNFPLGKDYASLDWLRVGGRLNGPITLPLVGTVTTTTEVAHTTNFNKTGVLPYKEIWRGEFDASKPIGYGWTGVVGVKLTEHVGATPLVKVVRPF